MAIGNRYFSLMFFNIVIGSLLPQRIDTPERSSDSDSPARGGRGEESEASAARLRLLSVRLTHCSAHYLSSAPCPAELMKNTDYTEQRLRHVTQPSFLQPT